MPVTATAQKGHLWPVWMPGWGKQRRASEGRSAAGQCRRGGQREGGIPGDMQSLEQDVAPGGGHSGDRQWSKMRGEARMSSEERGDKK